MGSNPARQCELVESRGFGTGLKGSRVLGWASAGVVKTAGSNPAELSELVESQGFGIYIRISRALVSWASAWVVKVAGSNPARLSELVVSGVWYGPKGIAYLGGRYGSKAIACLGLSMVYKGCGFGFLRTM